MEHALLAIALLLVTAKLAEGAANRLKLSAPAAYVAAGVLVGPVLGLVHPDGSLELFFALGLGLLFFLVGVDEMDISGVASVLRGRFFLAAVIAFAVPLGIGYVAVRGTLDSSVPNAITIASVLSLSSLGIVAKVLSDLDQLRKPTGVQIFTTVAILELVGLLVISSALQTSGNAGGFSLWDLLALVGRMAIFAIAAWALAALVLPRLLLRLRRWLGVPQLAFGLIMGGLLFTFVTAESVGLHGSLGALLFGTALSGLPHTLREEVMPAVRGTANGVFVPLFFASAGLHLDLAFTDLPLLAMAGLAGTAVGAKFAGAVAGALAARVRSKRTLVAGLMAKGVVEVALLLVLVETGIISQEVYAFLTLLMLAFIVVVPLVVRWALRTGAADESAPMPRVIPPSFARYALGGAVAADVASDGPYPPVTATVKQFVDEWLSPDRHHYVVQEENGKAVGIVSLDRVYGVPKAQWEKVTLEALVKRRFPRASPDLPLDEILESMATHGLTVMPVIEPDTGKLVGVVTSRSITGALIGTASQH